MSLTFAELAERTGDPPDLLRFVLAQEIALGRVAWTADGGYTLDPACFPRDVLAGLRALSGLRPVVGDRRTTDRWAEHERVTEWAIAGAEETG